VKYEVNENMNAEDMFWSYNLLSMPKSQKVETFAADNSLSTIAE